VFDLSPPDLVRRFTARPEEIAAVRHDVRDCAERNGAADPNAIALAVTEAITNAIVHAYIDAPEPGEIEVVVQCLPDDAGIEILVCDEGRGMMPRTDSPGLGLGLALIGRLTEELRIESPDSAVGVRVHMTFAIG
jgi:anti-sigma regulatory factor (Ser/Thr protein kinase)